MPIWLYSPSPLPPPPQVSLSLPTLTLLPKSENCYPLNFKSLKVWFSPQVYLFSPQVWIFSPKSDFSHKVWFFTQSLTFIIKSDFFYQVWLFSPSLICITTFLRNSLTFTTCPFCLSSKSDFYYLPSLTSSCSKWRRWVITWRKGPIRLLDLWGILGWSNLLGLEGYLG